MSDVTMQQVRAFLAVSRLGSFTTAADVLHRTQSAVTLQVRSLEDSLGIRLFDRTSRKVALTPAGVELLPRFAESLRIFDDAVQASADVRDRRVGLVRFACLPSVASTFVPGLVASYRQGNPGVRFSLRDGLANEVVSLLRSGAVEFGITDLPGATEEFTADPLLTERMCVVFLDGHPIQGAVAVDVAEMARHDLLLMSVGSNARRVVDLAFAAEGRSPVPFCEASFMSTAMGMVRAGLGVAVLPLSGVNLGIDVRLRHRVIDDVRFDRTIAIVRVAIKSLSPAADDFASHVRLGVTHVKS